MRWASSTSWSAVSSGVAAMRFRKRSRLSSSSRLIDAKAWRSRLKEPLKLRNGAVFTRLLRRSIRASVRAQPLGDLVGSLLVDRLEPLGGGTDSRLVLGLHGLLEVVERGQNLRFERLLELGHV